MQTKTLLLASPSLAALVAAMGAPPPRLRETDFAHGETDVLILGGTGVDMAAAHARVSERFPVILAALAKSEAEEPAMRPAGPRYFVENTGGLFLVLDNREPATVVRSYKRARDANALCDKLNGKAAGDD